MPVQFAEEFLKVPTITSLRRSSGASVVRGTSLSSLFVGDAIKQVEMEIFNMFEPQDVLEATEAGDQEIELNSFLDQLEKEGIHIDDIRLKSLKKGIALWKRTNEERGQPKTKLNPDEFHTIIKDNIDLVYKALTKCLVVPDFERFSADISDIFYDIKREPELGHNASYIPQLDRVDSNFWGISVCTVDGQRFNIGDVDVPFTVQSTSKAINYAIALSKYGEEKVHNHVGREPSGRLFNEIVLDGQHRPHNPMINAGAIMTVGLLEPHLPIRDRFDEIVKYFKAAAGYEHMSFNASVFLSERSSADRNNCLAYYMKEAGCYKPKSSQEENMEAFSHAEASFKDSLELYFQLCSLESTAKSSSVIAATLANGGVLEGLDWTKLQGISKMTCFGAFSDQVRMRLRPSKKDSVHPLSTPDDGGPSLQVRHGQARAVLDVLLWYVRLFRPVCLQCRSAS